MYKNGRVVCYFIFTITQHFILKINTNIYVYVYCNVGLLSEIMLLEKKMITRKHTLTHVKSLHPEPEEMTLKFVMDIFALGIP